MNNEDLSALLAIVGHMDPDARVDIGSFRCSASELLIVVDEAWQTRQWPVEDTL